MDTNKLKRFASEARNILISGVNQRLTALGFRPDGSVAEMPELKDGGAVFMGDIQSEEFYHKWMSLYHRVQSHSHREVVEEAAYTWFNRLVAIRIMVKNELAPAVLEYESDEVRIPLIVTESRQGRIPEMNEESRQKLETLLTNDALTDEQFQVLIVAYCHSNPIIHKCFGAISDYTELLLPSNILKNDGFIDRLNADDYISEEDYTSPELIGWLYQFYISERKDEVFAKKGKFEADEIPAATQIFTPNWIVKYMVQNTVGRIYLDNNPHSDIKGKMKYLVEPTAPAPADAIYQFDDIHDLTCADLGCGSGHILNECFDLLYQIYIDEGYNRKKAVENIFRYNLTGVDIDTRAKQLATFALLMKACQKDKSFADAHCMPRVLDMPVPYAEAMDKEFADKKDERAYVRAMFTHFLLGTNDEILDEITDAVLLMNDARILGSIMKFTISERTRNVIAVRTAEYEKDENLPHDIQMMLPYMRVILALTQNYSALVMNPPYMGGGNMNETLSKYVKENYEDSKADLFSVFMDVAIGLLQENGKYGMINMQSWMFLSSFEKLRKKVLDNQHIDSMLHLGPRTFDELSGEVVQNTAFVISKNHEDDSNGTYFRLVDGKNCLDKEQMFLNHSEQGVKIYFPAIPQSNFEKIPGCPIGYWVSDQMQNILGLSVSSKILKARHGLLTGNDEKYLRYWFEISNHSIGFNFNRYEEIESSDKVFFPMNKGGERRRWYGNNSIVIRLKGCFQYFNNNKLNEKELFFKEGLTWTEITNDSCIRYSKSGILFGHKGTTAFFHDKNVLFHYLGYSNTKVFQKIKTILFTGLSFTAGNFERMPLGDAYVECSSTVKKNISISKQDWDAHETSWDFQTNEIVDLDTYDKYVNTIHEIYEGTGIMVLLETPQLESLEWRTEIFKQKWEDKFMRLHANEEELNRQFIEIYGLQDELTPDVPLKEITILQQGEISIEKGQNSYSQDDMPSEIIQWNDNVLMKQLISYAVGCMMGRYSIDKSGLILANQGDGQKEYEALVPDSRFEIDDDGIIPLMSANTEFTDNISLRFKIWLSTTIGENSFLENLNYIERSLGKRLDDYFVKDFWKDHKKMYQNRPIYWLFSSKKGAFQCIVYMHRMNAYTVEKVRTGYLLPHIEWLLAMQNEMQANADNLSTRERREMDNIGKQIEECREYHERLHVVADKQIDLDLDDGVVVNHAKFGDVLVKLK